MNGKFSIFKNSAGLPAVQIEDGATVPFLMGDLDGDGDVNQDDRATLVRLLQTKDASCERRQLRAGDLNGNGKLDNSDFQELNKLLKERGKGDE